MNIFVYKYWYTHLFIFDEDLISSRIIFKLLITFFLFQKVEVDANDFGLHYHSLNLHLERFFIIGVLLRETNSSLISFLTGTFWFWGICRTKIGLKSKSSFILLYQTLNLQFLELGMPLYSEECKIKEIATWWNCWFDVVWICFFVGGFLVCFLVFFFFFHFFL